MADTKGGIAPNDFMTTLSDFIAAKTKEDSAAGLRRSIKGRFEKMGCHKQGLDLFLKLRKMEPADAELTLVSALRYCRWAQLGIGDQASLFPAGDDAGMPTEKAAKGLVEAQAYEEGFAAGKAGRDARDNRYELGSPLYARFFEGWKDGQGVIAADMGVDLPADGSTLRRKLKKGVETREAKPRGGRRGRARKALDEAREHLGT
jgi:hypothetical protein